MTTMYRGDVQDGGLANNPQLAHLQVNITPLGVFGGWLTATPSTGVIRPKSQTAIQLVYDVSQNEFQGRYQAEFLLTTTARPVARVSIPTIVSNIMQTLHATSITCTGQPASSLDA